MGEYDKLKDEIAEVIKPNGIKFIKGQNTQDTLFKMVDAMEKADTESKARDARLDGDIKAERINFDLLKGEVKEMEKGVVDLTSEHTAFKAEQTAQDKRIDGHEERIQENASQIAYIEGELGKHSKAMEAQDANIAGKQKKALIVEIRNTGMGLYASESASEIRNYAISGGDVFADYQDKRYKYDAFRNGNAYFRIVSVIPSKAVEERLIVQYNKVVLFERDEFTGMYDVTDLYRAMKGQTAVSEDFFKGLQDAIKNKARLVISDAEDGTIVNLEVVYVNKQNGEQIFSCFDGRQSFILSLNTGSRRVSLDTERIGAEFSIFNNEAGNNIFNIQAGASIIEIKEVLTDARGDERIPDTGDIFNVTGNTDDLTTSGIVISRTEDETGINIHLVANDIVEHFIGFHHLKFSYKASQGMDSLRLLERHDSVLDTSLLTWEKMGEIAGYKAHLEAEINEFNISAINGAQYDLQGAISALNEYLGSRPKFAGLKMVFVDTGRNINNYQYKGNGSFVSISSWNKL